MPIKDLFNLEAILRRRGGLFGVKPKIPIKSKQTLGMIYTPGVGHVCNLIHKDKELAWTLTNKANSMFVITDSTGFRGFNNTWNHDCSLPYLEAKTCYYKETANIDTYP